MKRLHRGVAPEVLTHYKHGQHNWEDVTPTDKAAIRDAIREMQCGLCAYCEGSLDALDQHVEHRCRKRRHPGRTFEWTNLFGSCDRKDSCGHFKDSGAAPHYECHVLLDPCVDDPDDYLIIRQSGRVVPCPALSDAARHRAQTTIDVLNLNLDHDHGGRSLCAERARRLQFYLQREPDLLGALASFSVDEAEAIIVDEIAATAHEPFSTIIRHFLRGAPA